MTINLTLFTRKNNSFNLFDFPSDQRLWCVKLSLSFNRENKTCVKLVRNNWKVVNYEIISLYNVLLFQKWDKNLTEIRSKRLEPEMKIMILLHIYLVKVENISSISYDIDGSIPKGTHSKTFEILGQNRDSKIFDKHLSQFQHCLVVLVDRQSAKSAIQSSIKLPVVDQIKTFFWNAINCLSSQTAAVFI